MQRKSRVGDTVDDKIYVKRTKGIHYIQTGNLILKQFEVGTVCGDVRYFSLYGSRVLSYGQYRRLNKQLSCLLQPLLC